MDGTAPTPPDAEKRTDRLLLLETALALGFLALLLGLYLVPSVTDQPFRPGPWRWILLAANLFLLVGLESRRRRIRWRGMLRELMRAHARGGRGGPA